MEYITHQAELDAFCTYASRETFVSVDTEFLRDKTYFPKLCLIQIACAGRAAAIDPLSPDIDLAPVFALLQAPHVVKVFHAARQDVEIFYLLSGHIPYPIFDTQVAAAVCGYGESVGYETLVNVLVGQDLDKSSRYTDWSVRPLSEKQLHYALSDVTHLRVIYEQLKRKLEQASRISWIDEEHSRLSNPSLYQTTPEDAWRRLKYGTMRPKPLACLRELAKWRETEARKQNVPRGRILKDDTLIEIAYLMPRKESDLGRLRGMDKPLSKAKVEAVLHAVDEALALDPAQYPQIKSYKKPPENTASVMAMLQLLLKVKADIHQTASSMIADKDDLEALALGKTDIPVLQGWRYEIFGRKAQALMQGKLKMSLNPKNKQVVFEEED